MRQEPDARKAAQQIHLRIRRTRRLLALGILPGLDGLAKLARMPPIEGHSERLPERDGPRVAHGHAHPRDGLHQSPMPADGEHEHRHDAELNEPAGHSQVNL